MPESYETVVRVKQDVTARLLAIPGVTAVGIGAKVTGGEPAGGPAIKVFVRDKRPAAEVPPEELIPEEIEGVRTDVEQCGDPVPLTGPPPPCGGAHPDPGAKPDPLTYRPLVGGATFTSEPARDSGTLGCLLWDPANREIGYALTNFHVIKPKEARFLVEKDKTKVGQPNGNDSSSKCCNDIVGVFAGGDSNDVRDEALVRLKPGMTWKAEILEIGPVNGSYVLTERERTSHNYQVKKRGALTGRTCGRIIAVMATSQVADNQMIIQANPAGNARVVFAGPGDSGAAVVNDANQVVGLLWAIGKFGEGIGFAYPIDHVLARFASVEKIVVEVADAGVDGNRVHTVPGGTTVAVPPEVADLLAGDPVMREAFQGAGDQAPLDRPWFLDMPPHAVPAVELGDDLARSASGRLLMSAWQRHRKEVTRLLDSDRQLMIVWHRGGGAALTQLFLRMLTHPEQPLPLTLNGEPLMTCLYRVEAELRRCGSADLRADLDDVRAALPELAGKNYRDILDALADRQGAEH
jgi:hypothetical protein